MPQPPSPSPSEAAQEFQLNSQSRPWRADLTISQLLTELDATGPGVAVERNGDVVRKADHQATLIQPADTIEVVRLVGGG
jgi:sulfur carrier protein